jgi:hypothetical protein
MSELASDVPAEGVRELGAALLSAQGRLGTDADWLREYTGLIASELRAWLEEFRLFQVVPLPPWGQEPITREAMRVCEDLIAEQEKVGDHWICAVDEPKTSERSWPSIVQSWEAHKALQNIAPAPQQRIPESVLRTMISALEGVRAPDVTWEQIRKAGADMCRHYGPVLLIPLKLESAKESAPSPQGKATLQFWREQEVEFRRYDTSENHCISAIWFSETDHWSFHNVTALGARTSAEENFKSLGREAARGLAGIRSPEPWVDWLDALRRAADSITGARLYSKITSTGSSVLSGRALSRLEQEGETIPEDALLRFSPRDEANGNQPKVMTTEEVEIMLYSEGTSQTVEHLFSASADFFLYLRSICASPLERPTENTEGALERRAGTENGVTSECAERAAGPAPDTTEPQGKLLQWEDIQISIVGDHDLELRQPGKPL